MMEVAVACSCREFNERLGEAIQPSACACRARYGVLCSAYTSPSLETAATLHLRGLKVLSSPTSWSGKLTLCTLRWRLHSVLQRRYNGTARCMSLILQQSEDVVCHALSCISRSRAKGHQRTVTSPDYFRLYCCAQPDAQPVNSKPSEAASPVLRCAACNYLSRA